MKFRRMMLAFICVAALLTVTACGGSKPADGGGEKKEEKQEEEPKIPVSGPEWASGDLVLNVPDGWEVSPDDDENDWEAEQVKVYESENIKDTGGSTYGHVYADIRVSDFSDISNAYSEDACKNYAEEYDDKDAIPKEYKLNDNVYLAYRNYGYVGDSAEDWAYLAYTKDGRLIEIRAYIDGDAGTEENHEAMQSLLASIKIGGEPLSAAK
ncbi:MAG: hypothetical protein II974_10475 [Firmicutes bacterium]|nr:hypothetical protein [Bacillota bacterium]